MLSDTSDTPCSSALHIADARHVWTLNPATRDFLAGAGGGMAGVLAGQPLDTVRVRLQQKGSAHVNALACWHATVAREGVRSLFRGMAYPLTTVALQNAVTFQAFGVVCRLLGGSTGEPLSYSQAFTAGLAGGVVSTAVQVPVDVLKIRLQLQQALPGSVAYVGPVSLLSNILMRNGLAGLYRGTTITLLRDVPSYGLYFALYEATRDLLDPTRRTAAGAAGGGSAVHMFAAGGIAGVASWLSVYPFDVVKSRVQAHCRQHSPYKGWVDCARQGLAEEGARMFLRGLAPSLWRAFVVNAAIFTTYEALLKALP